MERRRLLLSTVAVVLVVGTVTASAQTRRPSDQDRNINSPQTHAQPTQGQMRTNPQPSATAQNPRAPQQNEQAQGREQPQGNQQPQPGAQSQNAAPRAPSTTNGQGAREPQSMPAAANPAPQSGAGQVQPGQTQPNTTQGQAQSSPTQGQAQSGMTQGQAQPGNAVSGGNANAAGANGNAGQNANQQGSSQGVITLNEQQNTRVAQAIHQANVRPLTNVTFAIAVGTEIPASVELHVLPPALAEVVPQYRGYSFVVVEQEALIIDPGTHTIVAVVPFEAQQTTGGNMAPPPAPAPAQAAAPPPSERKQVEHARDERAIPRRQAERHRKTEPERHVTIERRTTTGVAPREPRVGDRVPEGAVIEGRPVEVYRDRPRVWEDRPHPSVRDIPLIGPLFGPRDDD